MNSSESMVVINSRKFDGTIHRSWRANLIEQKNNQLVFLGEFENDVEHPYLGLIRRGTLSYEFYWVDGWFNVFRFHEPDGEFRNFYCNINMPPTFEENVLDYVDLDIDILVWKDFSVRILDIEEFEQNSQKFNYPAEIKKLTYQNLNKVLKSIELRVFPFDYENLSRANSKIS